MSYDQRFNTGNPALNNRQPMMSGAVMNPGSGLAPPGQGAFAAPGSGPQGSVASAGYPSPQMPQGAMGQGAMWQMPAINPALLQLAENMQNQQPYAPGSPTAGLPSLGGGNAVGMGMGARGAFAGPGAGSVRSSGGRR